MTFTVLLPRVMKEGDKSYLNGEVQSFRFGESLFRRQETGDRFEVLGVGVLGFWGFS